MSGSAVLREVEERMLRLYFARRPFAAAQLGDGLFDGTLPPVGRDRAAGLVAGLHDVRRDLAGLLADGSASSAPDGDAPPAPGGASPTPVPGGAGSAPPGGSGLSADDRLTGRLMHEIAGYEIDALAAGWERFTVAPLPEAGLASQILTFLPYASVRDEHDAELFVRGCAAIPDTLDAAARELAAGRADGQVPVRRLVRRSIDQIDAYLVEPLATDRYLRVVAGMPAAMRESLGRAVAGEIRPAFARFRRELAGPVLTSARDDERPGLRWLPGGQRIYDAAVRGHTTLEVTARQVHEIGEQQVLQWRQRAEEIARGLGWTADFDAVRDRLRGDRGVFFTRADEILSAARAALERAERATPRWIGDLPSASCEVLAMDPVESPHGVLGHYETAPLDRRRPARYWVNVADPASRPRYEAEALAFHESVPGHHLQIAVAQELKGLPEFRKHQGVTAFVEGWALYTERLSAEMGLYTDNLDRVGMLSFDAWRACRLVVDTGLHAMGWTRQQAIDYMLENSCLAENNIVNEVDRYLTWPGQALAYKLGQLEILKLRNEARGKLRDRFDIREFHDAVLANGAVALPVLREQVHAWIAERAQKP